MSQRHDTPAPGVTFGSLDDTERRRAEILRTGERDPISIVARRLVYRRDHFTCQHCGSRQTGPMHLDHIVPWSAGGSDRTDNLRTLCGPCNQDRSNFVSRRDRPATPIVRICTPCLASIDRRIELLVEHRPDLERFDVYCGRHSGPGWALEGWDVLQQRGPVADAQDVQPPEGQAIRVSDCAEFLPFDGQQGVCARCGTQLTGRRTRWCGPKCLNEFWNQHDWSSARRAARRRDGQQCVREGCTTTTALEVNHIEPRNGQGYGWGCWNHLSNLETLCHSHHLIETKRQAAERDRLFRAIETARRDELAGQDFLFNDEAESA